MLGCKELVRSVLADLDSSPLSDAEKALMHFVEKVNRLSYTIGPPDIAQLHEVGYTDEQIWYATTVCALFNFYNRWVDASGVHAMSDEAHAIGAKRSAIHGYSRSSQPVTIPQPEINS